MGAWGGGVRGRPSRPSPPVVCMTRSARRSGTFGFGLYKVVLGLDENKSARLEAQPGPSGPPHWPHAGPIHGVLYLGVLVLVLVAVAAARVSVLLLHVLPPSLLRPISIYRGLVASGTSGGGLPAAHVVLDELLLLAVEEEVRPLVARADGPEVKVMVRVGD